MITFVLLNSLLLNPAAPSGAAWGNDGHKIVCEIAWARLTTAGRALVQQVRQGDSFATFAESCTWADDVRKTTHKYTYDYHFINIPGKVAGVDLHRDCGDAQKRCAPWAIEHYATILADAHRPRRERLEALRFLGHFVGDLHQPLHAGRPQDLGGNNIRVSFFGDTGTSENPMNLHKVWDSQVLRRAGLRWPNAAQALNSEITSSQATEWSNFDVLGWTNESYRIDEDYVYGHLPSDRKIFNVYYNEALGLSRVQLQRAGVRLAHLINSAADGSLHFSP